MHLFHSKITIELWNQEREGEFHSRTYSLPPMDPGIMQTKEIFFGYNSQGLAAVNYCTTELFLR